MCLHPCVRLLNDPTPYTIGPKRFVMGCAAVCLLPSPGCSALLSPADFCVCMYVYAYVCVRMRSALTAQSEPSFMLPSTILPSPQSTRPEGSVLSPVRTLQVESQSPAPPGPPPAQGKPHFTPCDCCDGWRPLLSLPAPPGVTPSLFVCV